MRRRFLSLRVLLSLCLVVVLSAAASAEKKKPPLKPVNINTANAIRGLGQKRLDKMRKYLTVGKPSSSKGVSPSGQTVPQPTSPSRSGDHQFETREIRFRAVSQMLPPL